MVGKIRPPGVGQAQTNGFGGLEGAGWWLAGFCGGGRGRGRCGWAAAGGFVLWTRWFSTDLPPALICHRSPTDLPLIPSTLSQRLPFSVDHITACSRPIHCLFTGRSLPAQCLFTACSSPVHCPFTACSLPVYCMFTACSLPVHCLFTARSLPVHCLVTAISL